MPSITKKQKSQNENQQTKKVQMSGFTGNLYQVKLLMLFLYNGLKLDYKYKLGTEIEEAEKFDDIVFEYEHEELGQGKEFVLVQAKHQTKGTGKIDINNLLTDHYGDFGVYKYFHSYFRAKCNKMFKNGSIKRTIVYTNRTFDGDSKFPEKWNHLQGMSNIFDKIDACEEYCELDLCRADDKGEFYRFNSKTMFSVLKNLFTECIFEMIAKCLVDSLMDQKKSPKEDKIEMYYSILLMNVIDVKTKKFHLDFVTGKLTDSVGLNQFRNVLMSSLKAKKLSLEIVNDDEKLMFNFKKMFDCSIEICNEGSGKVTFDNIISDDDMKEFLGKFVIAVGQPNESNLDEHLQSKLNQDFSSDQIHNNFFKKVTDWTNGKDFSNKIKSDDNRFISSEEALEFFTSENRKTNDTIFKGSVVEYEKKINELHFHFYDYELVNALNEFLNSSNKVLFVSTQFVELSVIKIYQFLTVIECEFITSDLCSLNQSSIVLKSFDSKLTKNSLLILNCDIDNMNFSVECQVVDILKRNRDKKIVIIAKNGNRMSIELRIEFSKSKTFEIVNDEKLNICNLINISQKLILEKTLVSFQDHRVYLKELVNEKSDHLIGGEQLTKILTNKELKFGKLSSDSIDINQNYINRKFFIQFDFDDKNIILISGINEDDFCNRLKNVRFENSLHSRTIEESENIFFNQHRERNRSKKIYLLRKDKEIIYLIAKTEGFLLKPNDIIEKIKNVFKKTIVLLTSSPGMGKTYVFSHLRDLIKKNDPTLWVYRIDLNAMSRTLKDIQRKKDFNEIALLEFLYKAMNTEEEIEKQLFKHLLEEGKTVLFLDGLDEVSPQYNKEMVKIIKKLQQASEKNRIFINTRPFDDVVSDFSKKNDFLSCRLQQFTDEDQIEFLRKSWNIGLNDEHFQLFVKKLLHVFNGTIRDDGVRFMGTALHTMMIATTFKKTYEKYNRSEHREIDEECQQTIKESLNLFTLYKKFAKIKSHDVYYQDKIKLDPSNPHLEQIIQKEHDEYVEKCQILSLMSIFEKEKIDTILDDEKASLIIKYKKDVNSVGDRVGLITSYRDEKPIFVHRSYAEYFVTDFIVDNISGENSIQETVLRFFLTVILEEENEMISRFANDAIHEDINETAAIWKCNNIIENMHGRTLHFTIECNCRNIARILIENNIDVAYINENDETVFHLIYETSSDQNVECSLVKLILTKNENDPEMLKVLLLKKSIDRKKTPFLLAAKNQNSYHIKDLILILRKFNILDDAIDSEDNMNENVLHLALSNKNLDVFECIINELKSQPNPMKKLLSTKNNQGFNPLMLATLAGNIKHIKCIINTLNEFNIQDSVIVSRDTLNNNILNLAAVNENSVVLKILLEDSKLSNYLLKILLQNKGFEDKSPLLSAAFEGNVSNMKSIISSLDRLAILEDEMNSRDAGGNNILHFAVSNKNDEVFDLVIQCLKKRPDLLKSINQCTGEYERSPLFYAAVVDNVKCFNCILGMLEEFDLVDNVLPIPENHHYYNILHVVVLNENMELFQSLVNVLNDRPEMLKVLLQHRTDENVNALMLTAYAGNIAKFKYVFDSLKDFYIFQNEAKYLDCNKNNVLQLAISNKNYDVFEFAMKKVKNYLDMFKTMLRNKNNDNINLLMKSVIDGNINHFKLVLDSLVEFDILEEVNSLDVYNNNILQIVFANKKHDIFESIINELKSHPELLKVLLKNKGNQNCTPLLTTARFGNVTQLKNILGTLRDLNILDDELLSLDTDNYNILQYAIWNPNYDSFEYITEELKKNRELLKSILRNTGFNNHTPLMTSIVNGNVAHFIHIFTILQELDIFEEQILSVNAFNNNILQIAILNESLHSFEYSMSELESRQELLKTLLENRGTEKYTPLMTAAAHGDVFQFKSIFESLQNLDIFEENINSLDEHNNNVLQVSISNNNYAVFKYVIDRLKSFPEILKPLLLHQGIENYTAFLIAAIIGNINHFKMIFNTLKELNILADVIDSKNIHGNDILNLAIINKKHDVLEYVMKELEEFPEMLKILLENVGNEKFTALLSVVSNAEIAHVKSIFEPLEKLKMFENHITALNMYNNNVFHVALVNPNFEVYEYIVDKLKKRPDLLKMLLRSKGQENCTPLLAAVNNEKFAHFKYIIDILREFEILESEIYAKDANDNNILHMSMLSENEKFFEYIMSESIDCADLLKNLLLERGFENHIPLMSAAAYGNFPHLKSIVDALDKFDLLESAIDCLDGEDMNVLQRALTTKDFDFFQKVVLEFEKRPEIFLRLLKHKAAENCSILHIAALLSCLNFFEFVFNKLRELDVLKDEIVSVLSKRYNILQVTVSNEKYDIFQYVLSEMRDSETLKTLLQHKNDDNYTSLLLTAFHGDVTCLKIVFDTMEKLNILDNELSALDMNDNSILHLAFLNKNVSAYEFVLNELKKRHDSLKRSLTVKNFQGYDCFLYTIGHENFAYFKSTFDILIEFDMLESQLNSSDINFLEFSILNDRDDIFEYATNELKTRPELLKSMLNFKICKSALLTIALSGNLNHLKWIFETLKGFDELEIEIHFVDENGSNFLQLAIANKTENALEWIIDELKTIPDSLIRLLNDRGSEGLTALLTSIVHGTVEKFKCIVETLIEFDILQNQVNFFDGDNNGILHLAVLNEDCQILEHVMRELKTHTQLFELILKYKGADNRTALLFAARHGTELQIKCISDSLRELNIFENQIEIIDAHNNNILHSAIYNKRDEVLQYLIESLRNRTELLRTMLSQKDSKYNTPLLTTANVGKFSHFKQILYTFIELGILDEIHTLDAGGKNLLQLAIFNKDNELLVQIVEELKSYPELLKTLLQHKDVEDNTVLTLAASKGDKSQFTCVFDNMINFDIFNVHSPNCGIDFILCEAEKNQNTEIFEYLLTYL